MTEVVSDEAPGHRRRGFSGPSFAAEVAARQPTAIVAACSASRGRCATLQRAMSARAFRVYTTDDVIGVELGGCAQERHGRRDWHLDGLGLGFNPRAALMTRGLAEMTRLGVALGARAGDVRGTRRTW